MLYQDRRALRTIAHGILYLGAVVTPQPLLRFVSDEVVVLVSLGALAALLGVYALMLLTIR